MIFFSKIYFRLFLLGCWKGEPNERPNMQEVVSTLKSISLNNIDQAKVNYPLVLHNSNLISNNEITDINNDLIVDNIPNIIEIENNMDLQSYEMDIVDFEKNFSNTSNQMIESS